MFGIFICCLSCILPNFETCLFGRQQSAMYAFAKEHLPKVELYYSAISPCIRTIMSDHWVIIQTMMACALRLPLLKRDFGKVLVL